MRGSERILFMGNMHCLCSDLEVIWQLKRIIVTDAHIYYYQHTIFKGQKSIEDWINYKESTQTLPQMQDRTNTNRNSLLDSDSITAPPQLVQSVSDRQVFLMPLEQLTNILARNGINEHINQHAPKAICLTNKISKEVQYMIPLADQDALLFYRAISVGNAFSKYANFCLILNQAPNQIILTWLQDCVPKIVPILDIEFEKLIPTYKHLIENTNLVNGLNFQFSLKQHKQTFHSLHSSLKADQLIHLKLKNCELNTSMIAELNTLLSNNIYLEELDLSNNQIDDKGIDILSRLFEHCSDIKKLDLSNNLITGQDINFEIFLLKMGQILLNISLDLGSNQLNDGSIAALEQRLIQDEQSNFSFINLSYNKFTRQGIWRLFNGLAQAKKERELQFKIFPLPFSIQMIQSIVENAREPMIIMAPKSRKTTSPHVTRKSFFDLKQQINPNVNQELLNLTIQRKLIKKIPVTTGAALKEIENMKQIVRNIFDGNPSVEQVYQICSEIAEFQYQLPFKLIMDIQEWVWHKLNEAILIRDHYAISYLTFAAFSLEMDTQIFKDKYQKLSRRMSIIEKRINGLINFQIEENKINGELNNLIRECYRLDIRGQPLDFLISLKIQSEELIRQYIHSDYDWQVDAQNDVLGDNTAYLERDIQKIDQNIPDKLKDININLCLHPQRIDYYALSLINIQEYEIFQEKLTKILAYLNTLEDKQLISSYTLEEFKLEDYKKLLYYCKQGLRRAQFFANNHFLYLDQQSWNDNYEDLNFNSIRLICNYNCAHYRMQQIRSSLEQINNNYQEMTIHEIIEDLDSKQNADESRFLISDLQIQYKQIQLGQEQNNHNSNPTININDYPFLGQSKSHLLNIEDIVYQYVAQQIQTNLRGIFKELPSLNSKHLDQSLLLRQIKNIIDICTNSPSPSLIADELYLHIIILQQPQFETQLINLFLLYIPPSTTLLGPLRNCLKSDRAINLLQRWHDSSPMPYWLPCEFELYHRLHFSNITVSIQKLIPITLQINEFDTVHQVMSLIYSQDLVFDKHSYWLYLRVEYARNQQIPLFIDIPLLNDLGFFESISRVSNQYPSSKNHLILKRRVHQAFVAIHGQQLDYYLDAFTNLPHSSQLYNIQSIITIAAIQLTIDIKKEVQEQTMQIMKYTKVENANDLKHKILDNLDISQHKFIQYLPNIHKLIKDPLRMALPIVKQLLPLNDQQLKDLLIAIMRNNPANSGNCFQIILDQQQLLMIITSFCILFYEGQNFDFAIMYQDILGIAISSNQMRIHTFKLSVNKYILSFPLNQALECYQDILAYQQMRLQDSLIHLYAYTEYYKMKYFYNIHLCDDVDQNNGIQRMMGMDKPLEKYHALVQSTFANQHYLVNFVKKQVKLLEILKSIPQLITNQGFIFHENCTLFQVIEPNIVQPENIGRYFGRNGREEVRNLYAPQIHKFPLLQNNAESLNTSINLRTQRESLAQSQTQSIKSPYMGRKSIRPQMESRKLSLMSNLSNQIKTEQNTNRSAEDQEIQSELKIVQTEDEQLDNINPKDYIYQINEIDEEKSEGFQTSKSAITSQFTSEIKSSSQIKDYQPVMKESLRESVKESLMRSIKSMKQSQQQSMKQSKQQSQQQSQSQSQSQQKEVEGLLLSKKSQYDESQYVSFVQSQQGNDTYVSFVQSQHDTLMKSVSSAKQSIILPIPTNQDNPQLGNAIANALARFPKQQQNK